MAFKMKGMKFKDEEKKSPYPAHDGTEEGTPEWAETHDPETGEPISPLNQGMAVDPVMGNPGVVTPGVVPMANPGSPGVKNVQAGFPYKKMKK